MLEFLIVATVATWLGLGLLMWAGQERLIFPAPGQVPRDLMDRMAAQAGAVPLALTAEDATPLYAWHAANGHKRLVLFFHGNGEPVYEYGPVFAWLRRAGWDAMVFAYRGYPGSGGSPSEAGIALDARAAWAWATGPGGYEPARVVLHGRSLGGGVAAGLVAGGARPGGLVLEQTFASVRELAWRQAPLWPVDHLLRHPFDTRSRAQALDLPVLVMHSTDDQVIPVDLGGRALAALLPRAEYHEVAGYPHGPCLPLVDRDLAREWLAFLERQVP